jgi:hypothetical protein
MDQDQSATVVTFMDWERSAGIIRNIGQLEADASLLIGPLSDRMIGAAIEALGKEVTAPWQIVEGDWLARVVRPEWKMAKGVGTGDAWLELAEIGPEDEEGFSWINVAIGAGLTRLGLELVFRRGLQDLAEAALEDDKLLAPLVKQGMVCSDVAPRLFFPIDIQAELLAQGFEMNDLDKALAPVGQATKKALAAKADLDRLIGAVRSAATRK